MNEPGWPLGNRPTPRKVWALWKSGHVMECEVNEHPLGYEVRLYQRGEFQSSQVFGNAEAADIEAQERKRELAVDGWEERPAMPSDPTVF